MSSRGLSLVGVGYSIQNSFLANLSRNLLKGSSKELSINSQTIKLAEDILKYNDIKVRFWKHREILGVIKTGSFAQDSRGRWYVNFQCEVKDKKPQGERQIGIDLGLKDKVTCSDGIKYDRANQKSFVIN